MNKTQVKSIMKQNLATILPESTLREAARKMDEMDCGFLPVGTKDDIQGIITDRDIVVRAVAQGKDVATEKVKDYMTTEVYSCTEEDTLEQAAEEMRKQQVGRLVVRDGANGIRGVITFGCILRKDPSAEEVTNVVQCAVGKKAA